MKKTRVGPRSQSGGDCGVHVQDHVLAQCILNVFNVFFSFYFNRGVCKSQDRVITGHPSDLISIDVLTQPYVTHPYNGPNPWGIEDLSVCLYDVDERADTRYYNGGSTDFL